MKDKFKDFLISQGYKEYTPNGNKSTVYAYTVCIERIIEWENMTWESLKNNISATVSKYDIGGEKEEMGKKSHNSYISALKAFEKFVNLS